MIYREKDLDYSSEEYCDLLLDDIVLSDFGKKIIIIIKDNYSFFRFCLDEQFRHLLNIDCALALSVCK